MERLLTVGRTGVLCIFLCFAVGVAGIFAFNWSIVFAIICMYVEICVCQTDVANTHSPYSLSSFLIIFIEIPLLLRICPTSQKFDSFVRRFETNYMRAAIYFVMSLIQWLSIIARRGPLIAAAVFLLLAAVFYLLAGVKGQGFVGSKTLGGQGVAQMIV